MTTVFKDEGARAHVCAPPVADALGASIAVDTLQPLIGLLFQRSRGDSLPFEWLRTIDGDRIDLKISTFTNLKKMEIGRTKIGRTKIVFLFAKIGILYRK